MIKKKKRREIWISGKDMTELHFLLALFCLLPQIEGGNIRMGGIWVILDFFTQLFLSLDRSEFLGLSCLLIVERIVQAISSSKERITCSFVNWMVKKKEKKESVNWMKYSEGFKDCKIVHWEIQLKPYWR